MSYIIHRSLYWSHSGLRYRITEVKKRSRVVTPKCHKPRTLLDVSVAGWVSSTLSLSDIYHSKRINVTRISAKCLNGVYRLLLPVNLEYHDSNKPTSRTITPVFMFRRGITICYCFTDDERRESCAESLFHARPLFRSAKSVLSLYSTP